MNRKKIILSILLGIIAISAMIISDKLYKEKNQFNSEKYGNFTRNAFVSHDATPLERESFDALNIIPIRE